jgi:hypothetical protein
MRRVPVAVLSLLALLAMPAGARADSECAAGAPGPGYKIMRLDLPEGSSFLTLQLRTVRQTRPNDGANSWHLAAGVFILNANGMAIEAYKIQNVGAAPRRTVVRYDGQTFVDAETPGPDVSLSHQKQRQREGLAPGVYYAVAFASDGGAPQPNDWWVADIAFSGSHHCTQVGSGDIVDLDQTEFGGGTQVYAPGAGHAEGIGLSYDTARPYMVGFMDARVEGHGTASLTYATPSASGTVTDDIVPFVTTGGAMRYGASYSGTYPLVTIQALAFGV